MYITYVIIKMWKYTIYYYLLYKIKVMIKRAFLGKKFLMRIECTRLRHFASFSSRNIGFNLHINNERNIIVIIKVRLM